MFRFSLGIALVAIGISSPWLVRDWLDSEADQKAAEKIAGKLQSWADHLRSRESSGDREEEVNLVVSDQEGIDSTLSSRRPYPVASSAMRLLKGLAPDPMSTTSGRKLSPPPRKLSRSPVAQLSPDLASRLAKMELSPGDRALLRIFKEEGELELWMRKPEEEYALFKVYRLAHRSGGAGPKLREGDRQSPEGFYEVRLSSLRPETRHHLGIDIGFPNEVDRQLGRGGSEILIHGGDGSAGAFVLRPADMGELYSLVESALKAGQETLPIHAFPFRMTDSRMEKEWKRQPKWVDFWVNLKEGYDFFENVNAPPVIRAQNGEYAFALEER